MRPPFTQAPTYPPPFLPPAYDAVREGPLLTSRIFLQHLYGALFYLYAFVDPQPASNPPPDFF